MKNSKMFLLFLLLFILFNADGNSQTANVSDYLPLQAGNVWVYQYNAFNMNPPCFASERIKVKLTGTNVYNGKTYFQSQISRIITPGYGGCSRGFLPFDSLLRVDSLSGRVLKYFAGAGCFTPDEVLLDSLKARLHDTVWFYCQHPTQYNEYVCSDTNNMTIFGTSRQSKRFSILGFEGGWARTYTKGIGLTISNCYSLACNGTTQLLGCVINGVVYGDTGFIVGVNRISTEIPTDFSLYQNYPNPFNPTTNIKFSVPQKAFVTITIYNVLGEEVTKLVNEEFSPGTYETNWDASNFPSGVYYYKLTDGDYTETKKMVSIK